MTSLFPKIDVPTYSVKLPVSKIDVTYRPYLTKEEKLLLMALESKDSKTIMQTIRQVAVNCVIKPENLNVDNLAMVDLEFLFLHLRAKSKGEMLESQFSCKADSTELSEDGETFKPCNNPILLKARIDELKVDGLTDYKDVIPLTDKIGVKMRLPRYMDMEATAVDDEMTPTQKAYALVLAAIESVYDSDQVYKVDKSNLKDLEVFLDSLSIDQFRKIEAFFATVPRIDYTFNVKCTKCGFDHSIHYKDTASFF